LLLGFRLILLVESIVHKFFGGHGHGHGHGDNNTGQNEMDHSSQQELSVKIPRVTRTHLAQDNLAFQEEIVSKTPLKIFNKPPTTKDPIKMVSSLRVFLVLVALSVHSLLEGMAVGLEDTSVGVWQLFLAIAIHSTAIVFCIGTGRH
jgi:zinc transporter ZupT